MYKNMPERKKLYRKGMSDREIADELGMRRDTVACWRYRNNLPVQEGPRKRFTEGVDISTRTEYERALVKHFMFDLIRLSEEVGKVPNSKGISNFMRVWRSKARG